MSPDRLLLYLYIGIGIASTLHWVVSHASRWWKETFRGGKTWLSNYVSTNNPSTMEEDLRGWGFVLLITALILGNGLLVFNLFENPSLIVNGFLLHTCVKGVYSNESGKDAKAS